jgi:hypothetical protein
MNTFLQSGLFGNMELDQAKKMREAITERWDKFGFCEGLSGVIKENICQIYENEAKHLIKEATNSASSGSFETVVFPMIRRVFSKLLANDIVSVQAMNLPIGKVFFILPVTSKREEVQEGVFEHAGLMGYNRKDKNQNGADTPRYYLPDDVVNQGAKLVQFYETTLYDLYYNDFLYDESKGRVTIALGSVTPVTLEKKQFKPIANTADIKTANDGTVHSLMLEVSGFNSYNAGKLTGPDGNEMDTEEFLASMKVWTPSAITAVSGSAAFEIGEEIPMHVMTQKYGKGIVEYNAPVDVNGKMFIEIDLTKPGKGEEGYVGVDKTQLASVLAALKISWKRYDSLELETEIGEVSFKLDSMEVSVVPRKLRATWSPELSQDVAAFHNIDAEAELTQMLSEQVAGEIDREILRDLRKVAPWQGRWDRNGWRRLEAFSTNYTQKDWNQELMTVINEISAMIHKATLRGGANYIVVSTEVSALLNNLEYFHVTDASAEQAQYNMGIERIGSLQGRYQVYVDPYAPHWSIIVGHKGKSLLDTGYIYAPYVPMALTPTMYNPENFAPVKGIMTRYAKKCVNNRYFGHVRVDGLRIYGHGTQSFR